MGKLIRYTKVTEACDLILYFSVYSHSMKYGFVTFECAQDAFTAIDSSPRDEQINMYDISFGGRRAFCRASYADLGKLAFKLWIKDKYKLITLSILQTMPALIIYSRMCILKQHRLHQLRRTLSRRCC